MSEPASRLLVLRHAHSSWAVPGQRDHLRPLDERGYRQAETLGRLLADDGPAFDAAACSSARRARETYAGLAAAFPAPPAEAPSDALYGCGTDAYYAAARASTAKAGLLVIGHNPMIAEFALSLIGGGDRRTISALKTGFPTCALAVIALPHGFAALERGAGVLERVIDPEGRF